MANRQLVDYVREQLAHGMNVNQLRTVLSQEGWASQDIEEAIAYCYDASHRKNVQSHHTNFLAIAILAIVVLLLAGALFFVVYSQPEVGPEPRPPAPDVPEETNQLTGWAFCAGIEGSVEKDSCYQDINRENKQFDCDTISDQTERSFCYRAKEAVMLSQYPV